MRPPVTSQPARRSLRSRAAGNPGSHAMRVPLAYRPCPARMDNAVTYVSLETYDALAVIKGPQSVIWGRAARPARCVSSAAPRRLPRSTPAARLRPWSARGTAVMWSPTWRWVTRSSSHASRPTAPTSAPPAFSPRRPCRSMHASAWSPVRAATRSRRRAAAGQRHDGRTQPHRERAPPRHADLRLP